MASLCYVAFTSTSLNIDTMKEFAQANTSGQCTILALTVCEARSILAYSLFPSEDELLVLPNAIFKVITIPDAHLKRTMGVAEHVDVIQMHQQPSRSVCSLLPLVLPP